MMTVTVYAARLESNRYGPDHVEFPFKVDVSVSFPKNPSLARCEFFVRMRRPNEENPFIVIPLQKPRSFEVNERNWFEILEAERSKEGKSLSPSTRAIFDLKSSLPTKIHWDHSDSPFLTVKLANGERYGLYIRNHPSLSLAEVKVPNVIFINNKDYRSDLRYTERALILNTVDLQFVPNTDRIEEIDSMMIIPFKGPIEPKEMMYHYFTHSNTLSISTSMFDEGNTSEYDKLVVPRKFHGFEYFISRDGGYIFTLQNNAVLRAINALFTHIRDLSEPDNLLMERYKTLINDLTGVMEQEDPDKTRLVLKHAIDIFENI